MIIAMIDTHATAPNTTALWLPPVPHVRGGMCSLPTIAVANAVADNVCPLGHPVTMGLAAIVQKWCQTCEPQDG